MDSRELQRLTRDVQHSLLENLSDLLRTVERMDHIPEEQGEDFLKSLAEAGRKIKQINNSARKRFTASFELKKNSRSPVVVERPGYGNMTRKIIPPHAHHGKNEGYDLMIRGEVEFFIKTTSGRYFSPAQVCFFQLRRDGMIERFITSVGVHREIGSPLNKEYWPSDQEIRNICSKFVNNQVLKTGRHVGRPKKV